MKVSMERSCADMGFVPNHLDLSLLKKKESNCQAFVTVSFCFLAQSVTF